MKGQRRDTCAKAPRRYLRVALAMLSALAMALTGLLATSSPASAGRAELTATKAVREEGTGNRVAQKAYWTYDDCELRAATTVYRAWAQVECDSRHHFNIKVVHKIDGEVRSVNDGYTVKAGYRDLANR